MSQDPARGAGTTNSGSGGVRCPTGSAVGTAWKRRAPRGGRRARCGSARLLCPRAGRGRRRRRGSPRADLPHAVLAPLLPPQHVAGRAPSGRRTSPARRTRQRRRVVVPGVDPPMNPASSWRSTCNSGRGKPAESNASRPGSPAGTRRGRRPVQRTSRRGDADPMGAGQDCADELGTIDLPLMQGGVDGDTLSVSDHSRAQSTRVRATDVVRNPDQGSTSSSGSAAARPDSRDPAATGRPR